MHNAPYLRVPTLEHWNQGLNGYTISTARKICRFKAIEFIAGVQNFSGKTLKSQTRVRARYWYKSKHVVLA
jgi:hypothetical protein